MNNQDCYQNRSQLRGLLQGKFDVASFLRLGLTVLLATFFVASSPAFSSAFQDSAFQDSVKSTKQSAPKTSLPGEDKVGEIPEGEVGVGIEEKDLGNGGLKLPLDLSFFNEEGEPVRLFDYFDGEQPVILLMNYSDCPQMCSVQLSNLVEAMSNLQFTAGKDFKVLSISINPKESASRAKKTKQRYVELYNRDGGEKGWNFLVGPQKSIKTLADTVGFKYRFIREQNHYSHAPIMMMCSPSGNMVRYVKGIKVEPKQLEIALVEAGEGKVGSTLNQLWIAVCYRYDVSTGKYTANVKTLMQFGGVAIVIVLIAILVPFWVTKNKGVVHDNQDLVDLTKNPGNFSSTS